MTESKRTISIGTQRFEDFIQNNYFYVDKTDFIREWWESGDAVTLITRPRRFGKTLNMDMINCFFSKQYQNRTDLFNGLSIWGDEKFRRLQGTFPVIFITFADVKQTTYSGAVSMIKQSLSNLYSDYYFLLDEAGLNPLERRQFESVTYDMSDEIAQTSVQYLCRYLRKFYGQKVIILLDEYDTPMQEAYVDGYWNQMASFMRGFFNATLKTNPYINRALMTGITRISKESIFSDLNNLRVVTTTSLSYSSAFGFTQEEVLQSLAEYRLLGQKGTVKKWYDGFTFGNQPDIYNPWSITNFLKTGEFGAYWANTSSNSLIEHELRISPPSIKNQMENLLNGYSLEISLDEQIIFDQLDQEANTIWSLLLAGGYLKVNSKKFDGESGEWKLSLEITNFEVKITFRKIIGSWFSSESSYSDFTRSLIQGNAEQASLYLGRLLLEKASFFDTKRNVSAQPEAESFYHGLVLGLVATENEYRITSNRESGFGRYDIMMVPKRAQLPGIIIEFKIFDADRERSLEDTAGRALQQIEEKKYETELLSEGIPENRIIKYGFGFSGKRVVIMKA